MSSVFGLNECNELVHVSEVGRGLACQCRCVACGEPLMARRVPCATTTLRMHQILTPVNQALSRCCTSMPSSWWCKPVDAAPVTPGLADFFGWGEGATEQWLQARGPVQQEVAMGVIRPDLLVATDDGVQVAIEIA
jgi:competence protein CoiA